MGRVRTITKAQIAIAARKLRAAFPTDSPVRVYLRDPGQWREGMFRWSPCQSDRHPFRYMIRIDPRLCPTAAIFALVHEWAHALDHELSPWTTVYDRPPHGPSFFGFWAAIMSRFFDKWDGEAGLPVSACSAKDWAKRMSETAAMARSCAPKAR